jgi:hypothetical protein
MKIILSEISQSHIFSLMYRIWGRAGEGHKSRRGFGKESWGGRGEKGNKKR